MKGGGDGGAGAGRVSPGGLSRHGITEPGGQAMAG